MDDQRIVELYWQRSEQAIAETSTKYGKYCYSIAHSILGNIQDAEESVNDTYHEAWNSMPPHRPSVLATFLGKITRRISIDKYRRKNAQKRGGGQLPLVIEELSECVGAGEEDVAEAYEKQRLGETIQAFVASLPETERKVFLCRYWYMDDISTVAKRFRFSESKVKSMLHRLRGKLYSLLQKEGFL